MALNLEKLEANLEKDAKWVVKEAGLVEQALVSPFGAGIIKLAEDVFPSEATAIQVATTTAGAVTNQIINWATTLSGKFGGDVGTITTNLMALITQLYGASPLKIPIQDILNLVPGLIALVNPAASAAATSGPSTPAASAAPSPPSETPAP